MKIENIDIAATIEKAQALIHHDEQMSAATKSIVEVFDPVDQSAGQAAQFEQHQLQQTAVQRPEPEKETKIQNRHEKRRTKWPCRHNPDKG